MTIDHDAIAARVRQNREAGTPGLWRVGPVDDTIVTAADGSEVAAVDGDYNEPDLWPIMEANARRIATLPDLEEAYLDLYDEVKRLRAERDRFEAALGRACQVGGTTYLVERAEKAEAERDRLRAALANLVSAAERFEEKSVLADTSAMIGVVNRMRIAIPEARKPLKGNEK